MPPINLFGRFSTAPRELKNENQESSSTVGSPEVTNCSLQDREAYVQHKTISTLGKRKRAEGLYNYTIKVLCSSTETFDVHQGLLIRHSKKFRALTSSRDVDIESGIFRVPGHDSDTIELMKEWLYRGQLPATASIGDPFDSLDGDQKTAKIDSQLLLDNGTQTLRATPSDTSLSQTMRSSRELSNGLSSLALTKIIVLAEDLGISVLEVEASTALVRCLITNSEEIPAESLIFAYEHAAQDSMIRKILIDYTALTITEQRFQRAVVSELPSEIWRDLVIAITPLKVQDRLEMDWERHAYDQGYITKYF